MSGVKFKVCKEKEATKNETKIDLPNMSSRPNSQRFQNFQTKKLAHFTC
jgi:hypothetical protein